MFASDNLYESSAAAAEQRLNLAIAEIGQRRLRITVLVSISLFFFVWLFFAFWIAMLLLFPGTWLARAAGRWRARSWVTEMAHRYQIDHQTLSETVGLVTMV